MPVQDDAGTPPAVLYVEDNALNAAVMEALFERRPDLQLNLACDGAAAMRSAQVRPPALLLLDLRLPDGHGATLLPRLRALPGLRDVPAVAVTAEDRPGLDLHGFDEWWPKPLRLRQVLARLEVWLPRPDRPGQGPSATQPDRGGTHADRPSPAAHGAA